ncbi:MAG: hypothetical protein H6828_15905, partial [Planctomycetes bacterium]|nr:hypothetical protein [Planctomycetota bacterium]
MSSSDETYKRSIKSSYQRQIKKARSRDEQRLLAENRKQRGKADKSRRTRQRDWDAADDDAETFEVMRPAPQVDLVRALRERGAAAEETQAFEPNALVVGVFPDRATVWLDGAARAAFLDERAPRPAVGDEALVEARGDGELRL